MRAVCLALFKTWAVDRGTDIFTYSFEIRIAVTGCCFQKVNIFRLLEVDLPLLVITFLTALASTCSRTGL